MTAKNPQAIKKYVKFDTVRREFYTIITGLQAGGFIDHLNIKSTIVLKESPEDQQQIKYNEKKEREREEMEGMPVSKFQFVERGTQSKNSMARAVDTQTEGPPRGVFSDTINRCCG